MHVEQNRRCQVGFNQTDVGERKHGHGKFAKLQDGQPKHMSTQDGVLNMASVSHEQINDART